MHFYVVSLQCSQARFLMVMSCVQTPSARRELPLPYVIYLHKAFAETTRRNECLICKKERASRHFVVSNANDPRFQEATFARAPASFANNDLKHDVNKLRAQSFASSTNTGILYGSAKDRPSIDALRARSDLPTQKIDWLNRHDRESGDFYGALPHMKGMPVAMTDHIDRSIDKLILKGRVGHFHSWVLAKDETSTFKT